MDIREQTYRYQGKALFIQHLRMEDKERPTLVFLHDALGSVASWKDFPQRCCERLSCHALIFDRLGHGRSDAYEGKWQMGYMEQEAEEVLPALLAQLDIKQPILIGISDGGSIALLAAANGMDCRVLVSIAGHIKVEEITQAGVGASRIPERDEQLRKGLQKYHGEKTDALLNNWQELWTSQSFSNWDISQKLRNIHCPALILQGEKDEYATQDHAQEIARKIGPQARLEILPDLGHFPTKEAPDMVLQLIQEFLTPLLP